MSPSSAVSCELTRWSPNGPARAPCLCCKRQENIGNTRWEVIFLIAWHFSLISNISARWLLDHWFLLRAHCKTNSFNVSLHFPFPCATLHRPSTSVWEMLSVDSCPVLYWHVWFHVIKMFFILMKKCFCSLNGSLGNQKWFFYTLKHSLLDLTVLDGTFSLHKRLFFVENGL